MLDILSAALNMAEETCSNSQPSFESKDSPRHVTEHPVNNLAELEDGSNDLTLGEVLEECLGPIASMVDGQENGDEEDEDPSRKTGSSEEILIKLEDEARAAGEDKPGLSYIALISMAIQSSPENKMLLSEIYSWIAEHYPYFSSRDRSWRNSIRHNLSLNECFIKTGRSENGKGNYWAIHPANVEDFSRGDFRRRRARRRVRQCNIQLERMKYGQHMGVYHSEGDKPANMRPTVPPVSGYVPMTLTKAPASVLIGLFGVEVILTPEERLQQMRSYQTAGSVEQNLVYPSYQGQAWSQQHKNYPSGPYSTVAGPKNSQEGSAENRPSCMYERSGQGYFSNQWGQAMPSHASYNSNS